MKKAYYFHTLIYNPKTGEILKQVQGPVLSRKVADEVFLRLLGKRNILSVETKKEDFEK